MDWFYSKSQIIKLLKMPTESLKLHISIEQKKCGWEGECENGGFHLCGGKMNIKNMGRQKTEYIYLYLDRV